MIEFRPFLAEPLANGAFTVLLGELSLRLMGQYRPVSGHFPPVVHIRSGAYLNAEATLYYIQQAYEDYNRRAAAYDPKMGAFLGGRGHRLIQAAVELAHKAEQSQPELPLKVLQALFEAGVKASREIRFSGGLAFPVEAVLAGDPRIPEGMVDELHLDEAAIAIENYQKHTPERFEQTAREMLGPENPRTPVMEAANKIDQYLKSGKGYEAPEVIESGRGMRDGAARAAVVENRSGEPMPVEKAQVMVPEFAQEGQRAQETGRRQQAGKGAEPQPSRKEPQSEAEPAQRQPQRKGQPSAELEAPSEPARKDAKAAPVQKADVKGDGKDSKSADPKQLQGKIQEAAQALAKAGVQAASPTDAPKAPQTPTTPQVQPDRGPAAR